MSTPVCLQNNILVELPKAFQDELITTNGLKFYQDTTFRPEWNVTIQGKVTSVPLKITAGDGLGQSLDPDRPRIRPIVKPGDDLIFSYTVVMKRAQTDNTGEVFLRDNPTQPYVNTWTNYNGQKIVRIYLQNDKWEVGLFDTKTKTWIDRLKGGERDVENFMGKYMPTENVGFNYNNLLPYDGKDYWMVDYAYAVAIKRALGVFDMIGDYVLIEPIREPNRGTYQGIIEVYEIAQDTDYRAIGKVLAIGEPLTGDPKLSVKPNDIICSDIRYVQKYEIDGKDYWVIRQKHIYGKQSVTNDNIKNTGFH
jgi:co-chaperonin GroES (HSP10)